TRLTNSRDGASAGGGELREMDCIRPIGAAVVRRLNVGIGRDHSAGAEREEGLKAQEHCRAVACGLAQLICRAGERASRRDDNVVENHHRIGLLSSPADLSRARSWSFW